MQKTLKSRKFVALLLALMMALAILPMSAMAADGDYLAGTAIPPSSDVDCSTYVVSTTTPSTSATVTFVIEAGDCAADFELAENSAFRKEITTTLTSTEAKSFTVEDVLAAVNNTNGLTFDITTNSYGHAIFLNGVTYGGNTWEAGAWGYDGWVFRVNDKYPVQATADGLGYEGTLIDQTYVSNGDVIHFFYDYPSNFDSDSGNVAANNTRGVYTSRTANSVTIQLQGHNTYIDPSSYVMSVNKYVNAGSGITAYLYDASGNQVGTAQTSGENGQVTFTGSIPAGTYTLKTDSVLFEFEPDSMAEMFVSTAYFAFTGAYCKIDIPAA